MDAFKTFGVERLPDHSPGSWKAERCPDIVGILIYSRMYGPADLIATVEGIWAEQEANARLIAAAPLMKSLLQGVLAKPGVAISAGILGLIRDVLADIETPLPEHQSGPYQVIRA